MSTLVLIHWSNVEYLSCHCCLHRSLRSTGRTGRDIVYIHLLNSCSLARKYKGCFLCNVEKDGKHHWKGQTRWEDWTGVGGCHAKCPVAHWYATWFAQKFPISSSMTYCSIVWACTSYYMYVTTCHVTVMWSVFQVHSREVAYHDIYSPKDLKSAVKNHIYPPAIPFVVKYDSSPDCSMGAKREKLSIEGTSMGQIVFPFEVYQVKKSKFFSSAALQHSD